MPQTSICRMCLGTDVRMITIVGTPLQAVYEKITDAELLDNMKPVVACYICLAQLRRCRSFMEKSVKADEVLNGILMNNTLTMKSVARIDRNSYNLCHTLSIKVTSEDQEVDEGKIKKELEFEFAGAEENQVEATFEEHTDFAPLNEPVVHIDEKAFEQPVDAEFLEVTYMKEEKEEIEPPVSDADDNREADSEDDIPLRPVSVKSVKTNKRKRDGDSDWKPAKKVASEKAPAAKKEPTTKKEPGKQKKRDSSTEKPHLDEDVAKTNTKHPSKKEHACNICEKVLSSSFSLKRHLAMHSSEKRYECTVCNKKFNEKGHLKSHTRTHTGEKPYECNICKEKFNERATLNAHTMTHTGEKPYECPHCSSSFRQKNILTKHIRTHTGEKPHKCHVCEHSFVQRSHLVAHLRTHNAEKAFECDICPRKFNYLHILKAHLRIHYGEKPYECNLCSNSFHSKNNLTTHIKTKHSV